jgi:hypothetical protein
MLHVPGDRLPQQNLVAKRLSSATSDAWDLMRRLWETVCTSSIGPRK